MGSKRAIENLVALVRADPMDICSRLKLGDLYAKEGEVANALATYEGVAKYFVEHGFMLKGIAVYKQICAMVVRDAPELRQTYAHVPLVLADALERIGCGGLATEALDALGPNPASGVHGPS